jgi:hypothetical protein
LRGALGVRRGPRSLDTAPVPQTTRVPVFLAPPDWSSRWGSPSALPLPAFFRARVARLYPNGRRTHYADILRTRALAARPQAQLSYWKCWSGRGDSNPRPQPWQGCALPLSYTRLIQINQVVSLITLLPVWSKRTKCNFRVTEVKVAVLRHVGESVSFARLTKKWARRMLLLLDRARPKPPA